LVVDRQIGDERLNRKQGRRRGRVDVVDWDLAVEQLLGLAILQQTEPDLTIAVGVGRENLEQARRPAIAELIAVDVALDAFL
jgi:hypothetical protein